MAVATKEGLPSRIRLSPSISSFSPGFSFGAAESRRVQDEHLAANPHKIPLLFMADVIHGYRTVFNLYCIEERSHKEIAELLGINEKSSSSQLFRARTLLARRIKDYLKSQR